MAKNVSGGLGAPPTKLNDPAQRVRGYSHFSETGQERKNANPQTMTPPAGRSRSAQPPAAPRSPGRAVAEDAITIHMVSGVATKSTGVSMGCQKACTGVPIAESLRIDNGMALLLLLARPANAGKVE
jgi:hypothetical protein